MQYFQRLRDIREDHDLTQTQVAAILNTSQEQYSRWERGAWQMPIEHYKTLSRFYNISVDYLSGLTNEPRTLDGRPFSVSKVSKNITINQTGNGQIHIKN